MIPDVADVEVRPSGPTRTITPPRIPERDFAPIPPSLCDVQSDKSVCSSSSASSLTTFTPFSSSGSTYFVFTWKHLRMMLYFLNTSVTLVALVAFPVLLVLIYLVQKRQKQGSLLLRFPVIPTLLLSDISSALTDWAYIDSFQQCAQQQTCH